MLTNEIIVAHWNKHQDPLALGRFVEAGVRKDDAALIRWMLDALEHHTAQTRPIEKTEKVMAAARRRLLDSDLSHLTERGKEAWAGVDPQKLREGTRT